jgi:hypothetical protein
MTIRRIVTPLLVPNKGNAVSASSLAHPALATLHSAELLSARIWRRSSASGGDS